MNRLIQPNNQLKVLIANVQSLLPKFDKLIALIQVENFDVIALNLTLRIFIYYPLIYNIRTWWPVHVVMQS